MLIIFTRITPSFTNHRWSHLDPTNLKAELFIGLPEDELEYTGRSSGKDIQYRSYSYPALEKWPWVRACLTETDSHLASSQISIK